MQTLDPSKSRNSNTPHHSPASYKEAIPHPSSSKGGMVEVMQFSEEDLIELEVYRDQAIYALWRLISSPSKIVGAENCGNASGFNMSR